MSDRIHYLKGKMQEDEDWLQKYIANHPEILPLRDLEGIKQNLVLLGREFWGSDILFIDEKGLLTIVEVKMPKDTRSKRGVLAQIFDYASYFAKLDIETFCKELSEGILYLKEKNQFPELLILYEKMSQMFSEDLKTNKKFHPAIGIFAKHILVNKNEEEINYWCNRFKIMLEENSFRLIIVINKATTELIQLTNYVTSTLSRGLQLAVVELSPEKINSDNCFIPHIVGVSGTLSPIYYREEKFTQSRKCWNENSFIEDAKSKLNEKKFIIIKKLLNFTKDNADKIEFGTGKDTGSFGFKYQQSDGKLWTVFNVFTDGRIWIFGSQSQYNEKIFDEFKIKFRKTHPGLDCWPSGKFRCASIDIFIEHENLLEKFKTIVEELGERLHT